MNSCPHSCATTRRTENFSALLRRDLNAWVLRATQWELAASVDARLIGGRDALADLYERGVHDLPKSEARLWVQLDVAGLSLIKDERVRRSVVLDMHMNRIESRRYSKVMSRYLVTDLILIEAHGHVVYNGDRVQA